MEISTGCMIGEYRIGRVITKDDARTEYEAFPPDGDTGYRYSAVEYDLGRLGAQGPDDPMEFSFLEESSLDRFPTIVEGGRNDHSVWAVLRLPDCPTVREYVACHGTMEAEQAAKTVMSICSCILWIHSFDASLSHFNITPDTVRVCIGEDHIPQVYLEGLGRMSRGGIRSEFPYPVTEASFYMAPELFIGRWSEKADVFSLSLILYLLLTGEEYPWDRDPFLMKAIREGCCDKALFIVGMGNAWNTAPDLSLVSSTWLRSVVLGGLSTNPDQRIGGVQELQGKLVDGLVAGLVTHDQPAEGKEAGFKAVAGMHELKQSMTDKFILPVRNASLAKAYGITPPNGCLLYGPPGCGKTFIVEKIAEEAGLPCQVFKPSDMASIYVHGGQERIRSLFDEAREQAPVMICFDEADALVGDRGLNGNEHTSGEVNEFLAQLNSLASDGVYVFLMTNYPERIDPAILRTGRIDEKIYVPLPDKKAREELFRLRLGSVPLADDVDMEALAAMTEGRTFSDLEYIVRESCLRVFVRAVQQRSGKPIPVTMSVIRDVISSAPYSVSSDQVRRYEALRDSFENRLRHKSHARIGFKQNLLE